MCSINARLNANASVIPTRKPAQIEKRGRQRHIHGFLLIALLAAGAAKGVSASEPVLKVTIQTEQKSVKNGESFLVTTAIQNIGKNVQTLHIMLCSYDGHWVTSSGDFVDLNPVTCMKNFPLQERLEPGKFYKRDLSLHVENAWNKPPKKSITFRLGFRDGDEQGNTELSEPVWSNPITIAVTE